MLYKNHINNSDSLKITPDKNYDKATFENKSDAEVWRTFCSGSDEALIFIYNTHIQRLLRFGLQFATRETVKDAIQDLFINLKETKGNREIKRITPYLYKSLYRIIKRKRSFSERFILKRNEDIKNWEIHFSIESKLIDQEQTLEQSTKLQKYLNDLSSKQRKVLLLYFYEGFTHNEIKEIMDLSNKSSVRKLIYRAIESLRRNFSRKRN